MDLVKKQDSVIGRAFCEGVHDGWNYTYFPLTVFI